MVAALPVSVTDDVTGARAQAAEQFAMYAHLPSYRAMLDREGFAGPEDAAIIGDERTVSDRIDELRAAGVDEFVPRSSMLPAKAAPAPAPCSAASTPDLSVSRARTAPTQKAPDERGPLPAKRRKKV